MTDQDNSSKLLPLIYKKLDEDYVKGLAKYHDYAESMDLHDRHHCRQQSRLEGFVEGLSEALSIIEAIEKEQLSSDR